jgi:hypothetical protein
LILDNFKSAVALNFAYYNLVLIHKAIRMTPVMALGVSDRLWSFGLKGDGMAAKELEEKLVDNFNVPDLISYYSIAC